MTRCGVTQNGVECQQHHHTNAGTRATTMKHNDNGDFNASAILTHRNQPQLVPVILLVDCPVFESVLSIPNQRDNKGLPTSYVDEEACRYTEGCSQATTTSAPSVTVWDRTHMGTASAGTSVMEISIWARRTLTRFLTLIDQQL